MFLASPRLFFFCSFRISLLSFSCYLRTRLSNTVYLSQKHYVQQYLHKVCRNVPNPVLVITIEDDADVSTLLIEESEEIPKVKQRRKSVRDKNTERVLLQEKKESELEIKNLALKSAFKLLDYAKEERKKLSRNKKYIENQVKRDPNYIKPLGLRAIVSQVNEEYGTDTVEKPVTRTTLMRYYKDDIRE